MAAQERVKMLTEHLCGDRLVMRLDSIGVERLADLRRRDRWEALHEINVEAGRPIWHAPMAIVALQNLIDAAEREGTPPPAG